MAKENEYTADSEYYERLSQFTEKKFIPYGREY